MTTIYLVRHGQKLPHAGDPGLTEIGIQQAKETGEYLKQFPISKIITSPYKRAMETAQQISSVLDLEYALHDSLIERMNRTDEQISHQEFFQEWIKTTNDRDYTPKYGDSSFTTGQRIQNLIDEITSQDEHVVLVTHGGAILDFLRNVLGDESVADLRTTYEEGNDYQMMNCAVNKVVWSATPVLELLNFVGHLTNPSE